MRGLLSKPPSQIGFIKLGGKVYANHSISLLFQLLLSARRSPKPSKIHEAVALRAMAPRKKSSSASKKSNQMQQSQPSKFGIQHFFERHSQAAAATAVATQTPCLPQAHSHASAAAATAPIPSPLPPPDPSNPPEIPNSQSSDPANPTPSTTSINPPQADSNANKSPLEISPNVSKTLPNKRFKFSPGAVTSSAAFLIILIKQSQDDGVDEVTWRISPVNERLRSVAKDLPDMIRVLTNASKLNTPNLRPCSQNQACIPWQNYAKVGARVAYLVIPQIQISPGSSGKLEEWLSSPTLKPLQRTSCFARRVSFQAIDHDKGLESKDDPNTNSIANTQSPFQTPPSMSYCTVESNVSVLCNGVADAFDRPDSRQHRKALLELLDQVEDVITVEEPVLSHKRSYLLECQGKRSGAMSVEADPLEKVKISSERVLGGHDSPAFLVLEVCEKHRASDQSGVQNPFKVLRLLNEHSGEERVLHLHDEW
ncbi:hypothetical protein ACLOJK_030334 [Asimina triloba]